MCVFNSRALPLCVLLSACVADTNGDAAADKQASEGAKITAHLIRVGAQCTSIAYAGLYVCPSDTEPDDWRHATRLDQCRTSVTFNYDQPFVVEGITSARVNVGFEVFEGIYSATLDVEPRSERRMLFTLASQNDASTFDCLPNDWEQVPLTLSKRLHEDVLSGPDDDEGDQEDEDDIWPEDGL